jgi:hypothetical protein
MPHQGNGDKQAHSHVVYLWLKHQNLKVLLSKHDNSGEPAVFKEPSDAELCASQWRERLTEGDVRIAPCGAM